MGTSLATVCSIEKRACPTVTTPVDLDPEPLISSRSFSRRSFDDLDDRFKTVRAKISQCLLESLVVGPILLVLMGTVYRTHANVQRLVREPWVSIDVTAMH